MASSMAQPTVDSFDLLLHTPNADGVLSRYYQQAFSNAVELFIVTAYLTEWDYLLRLNPNCRSFRVIIGKDFGITRKAACERLLGWLPPERKGQFMVADQIAGFHPKAVFWKENNGNCFALVGSSNLTRAAFETNFEANIFCLISKATYGEAKKWVKQIEKQSVPVSEDWLKKYKEASIRPGDKGAPAPPVAVLKLPYPRGMKQLVANRRKQLAAYAKQEAQLINLFHRCANRDISSKQFYQQLPTFWSDQAGDRLQGAGWERQGKESDFRALCQSFLKILHTPNEYRDDAVAQEIDKLKKQGVAARGAFLSEMLCLKFPEEYPVLNRPVMEFLKDIQFRATRGATEGVRYIGLAQKLRNSLLQYPGYPAKNLAELDTIIWLAYGKKSNSSR
ncbi:MAG TPA: phospholipase D family protein [Candidatus Angelobacter sp.]|nr:phospholipase D family protein [Candidatus Angelobacter sp.]